MCKERKFGETAIHNVGGDCFTAIINDHYYYDENLIKKPLVHGTLYFPSILIKALGVQEDISGESLYYQDEPGEPRFTLYKNMSFVLSKVNHSTDLLLEKPISCIATYNSYEELPSWMGVGKLKKQLEKEKLKKETELIETTKKRELSLRYHIFHETFITCLVLFSEHCFLSPIIRTHSPLTQILYFGIATGVIIRSVGSTVRMYLEYKKFKKTIVNKK